MFSCFNAVKQEVKSGDCVVVEYPFVDQNPLVYLKMKSLHKRCLKVGAKLTLSLHEYERVHNIRKWTIRQLVKNCDTLFVTKENQQQLFGDIVPTYIRKIPSNITVSSFKKQYTKNFIYFGLINKTKAIKEMLQGWSEFNSMNDNKFKLYFVTSSNLENIKEFKKFNIEFVYGAGNDEVAKRMIDSSFSIVPIIPFVGEGNATLILSLISGVIPIGIFKGKQDFNCISISNYTPHDFCEAFSKCICIEKTEFLKFSDANKEFGKPYDINSIVKQVFDLLQEETNDLK